MIDFLTQLGLFSAKALIIVLLIFFLLIGILAIVSRGKGKQRGKITIKDLNKKYQHTKEFLSAEILSKKNFKKFLKAQKNTEKQDKKSTEISPRKNIFVVDFQGDIKASAVTGLREEVTAILSVATINDEVVVLVESMGGMVHAYGLAASQLKRIRQQGIPLTVIVDKVAASGGYMMACIANKILAAPFAIIGSIGVIVQMPNFHRLLKEKHIDFEQLTAGSFKRTLTLFGHNTDEAREKMRTEIEEIHGLFKDLIVEHRPQINIKKVSTGEHWLGSQAIALNLIDDLQTSDDYLLQQSKHAQLYQINYHTKKTLGEKISSSVQLFKRKIREEEYFF